MIEDALSLLF